jgi:hypothetical protein
MPKLGWQGSTAPQILSLRTKQRVQADNNGLHRRNEGAHPSQVKPRWPASYRLQQSDGIGYDRNRDHHQGQKRGHKWSYRSHSARLACTCIMVTPRVQSESSHAYIQEPWRQYISICLRTVFVSGKLFKSIARISSTFPATFEAKGNA